MPADTSPVWAPAACAEQSCAPQRSGVACKADCAAGSSGNGTHSAASQAGLSRSAASANSHSLAHEPFIFQLPMTSFVSLT